MFTYSSFAQKEELAPISTPSNKIDLEEIIKGKQFLDEFLESSSNEEFRVFVKTDSNYVVNLLKRAGRNVKTFYSYSGTAISISKANLLELIFDGLVIGVWENSRIYTSEGDYSLTSLNYTQEVANYTKMVTADSLWSSGLYGRNTKVAILDSGIKTDHPALNVTMSNINRITDAWNFIGNNADVEDDHGHGTSVAGIIGGNGLYGYDRGVAPNCSFMIGKILDYNGMGTIELLIQGIDWAIANNADIINLSLGTLVTDKNSPDIEAVNNAVGNDTIVCVAAGNARGKEEFGYNDMYTILSPGIAKQAITVGAIDSNRILYKYSGAGPVAVNYDDVSDKFVFDDIDLKNTWLKPDVVAPGVMINTTAFESQETTIVSGTSFSTAVVSGICSLLKEFYPDNKPSTFKASFLETSIDISPELETPLGESIELIISSKYQGAGLINATAAGLFLINPPLVTIWPNRVPFTKEVFQLNEYDSFFVSIFVNGPVNSLSVRYYAALRPSLTFFNVPRSPEIGQYDILVNLATTKGNTGPVNFPVNFNDGFSDHELEVSFYIAQGKGRILYDCNELGEDIHYSMYGNLNTLLDISRYLGFIPSILSKDGIPTHFSDLDLNHFEAITLINHNSSSLYEFTLDDETALLDYILPDGEYNGGSIIFLPTRRSDFISLNSILESFNITYNSLLVENESLDLSSVDHQLVTNYNSIDVLSLPSPLEVVKENDTVNTIADRFVYLDSRLSGGSLILACNNVEMFLNSPYLFNAITSTYEEKQSSLNFGSNYQMYENILTSSATSDIVMNYTISNTEIKLNSEVQVTISASNDLGPITGWDFFLTLETLPQSNYRIEVNYYELVDYNDGNYTFFFSPGNYPISGGTYLLSVRSPYETTTWSVYLIENYSWGPTLVTISIAVCVAFLVVVRIRISKK
ncbi:MAG: S8 family peptidase [Candidatus Heimdallarchaeaceae archaeon]